MDASEQGRWRRASRIAARVLAVILAILGPLIVRAAIEGRAELRAADDAGTSDQAIVHLGRAARWRLPIAAHDDRARERLEAIATEAEQARDDELALVAWRELRGALLGTRTFSVVDPEQLERANLGIVRSMSAIAEADGETAQGERWSAELEAPPATDGIATRLAALCFALWWATSLGLAAHGIGRKRAVIAWAGANLAFLVGWLSLM